MKTKRLAVLSLAIAALLPSVTSCSSDPNPFDIHISNEKQTAAIQLRLNVEDTRAGELSTDEEKEIKKLTVHVFDDKNNLETTKNVTVTNGSAIINMEVSKGLKTLYVVTAKSNVNLSVGTSMTDYENTTFNSALANIKTNDGFVMVGKSGRQLVVSVTSEDNLPQSNIFNVSLKRLVAKVHVRRGQIGGGSFGFNFGDMSFKPFQLCEQMMVLNNGSDIFEKYKDSNGNGTCDNYTLGVGGYLNAITHAVLDFTADGCAYLSENIVSKPLSGNTTFLSICLAMSPTKYYTFNTDNLTLEGSSEEPKINETFYTVGVKDEENGLVDYALAPNNKDILTFLGETDAENYMNSLNMGNASTFTVSQTDKPMMVASSEMKKASGTPKFEVFKFNNGYAYYRVNIAHEDSSSDSPTKKFMVQRNKFYKVNINSVKTLGFSSEDLLRPKNPNTVLDIETHGWISAKITVEEWDEVEQNVDL